MYGALGLSVLSVIGNLKPIPIHMSRMGGPKGTAVAGKPIGQVAHFKNHAARRRAERAERAAMEAGDHDDFYRVSRGQALKHAKQSDLKMVPVWRGIDARVANEIRSQHKRGEPFIPKRNLAGRSNGIRRKGIT